MKKEYRIKKGYFTTGEFAKLCNVKKQTMFHYDDIGILKPEVTRDNGYRYYSYMQLETFATISMLRELGMPLAEIKEYLERRSPEAFLELLDKQSVQIDKKIDELMWLKTFVERRQTLTKEGISARHGEIFRESRQQEHYIITEHLGGVGYRDTYRTVVLHQENCRCNRIYSPNGIGGLVRTDAEFIDNRDYLYSHVYTRFDPIDVDIEDGEAAEDENGSYGSLTIIPPRKYLCICSTKGYEPVPSLYKKLLEYVKVNNMEAGEYFYEEALLDDMSNFSYMQHTIKISLPLITN